MTSVLRKNKNYQTRIQGMSLIEAIIALAIFSMIAAVIITMSMGGFNALTQGDDQSTAEFLTQEAMEAIKSIREGAWNELAYGQSSIDIVSNQWTLNGEGTSETIGKFTRNITFTDVCRDALDEIVECPGSFTDINSKLVTVEVDWQTNTGKSNSVVQSLYLTNWDSQDWPQTDWIGGSGQTIWNDETKYDYADANIDVSDPGEIKLLTSLSGECAGYTWHFNNSADYVYDSDFIRVQDSTAQLRPSSEIIIGIEDTPVDTIEFDDSNGETPDIIQVTSNIYALAYQGTNNDGFVRTIEIDNSGNITDYYLDSLEFDSSECYTPDIVHVAGDVYAIAYRGRNRDGYVVTVEIDETGDITNYVLDSLEYNTWDSYEPQIIQTSANDNIFAIVYRHILSGGAVRTIEIDDNGDISNDTIDWYLYSMWNHYDPDIINVTGDYYAVAWRGSSDDGYLMTIRINSNGYIYGYYDYYEYDDSRAYEPDMAHVTDNILAIAYRGNNNDGYIQTIEIDNSGNITTPYLDVFEYAPDYGYDPQIAKLTDTLYGVVYHEGNSNGNVAILNIEADGTIADSVMDTFSIQVDVGGGHMAMTNVAGYVYAVAYDGDNNDGFVTTVEMATTGDFPDEGPAIYPVTAYAPSVADQWVKIEETAYKDGGEIYYQISDDNGINWYWWDGNYWSVVSDPTDYNTAEEINEVLWRWNPIGTSFKFKAFLVGDGTQDVQLDAFVINCSNLQFELGSVEADENWVRVPLENVYSSPIIVAGYYENNNSRPASVRLDNVTSTFFDIRLQNPFGRNIYADTIDYLVIEEGAWEIGNRHFVARTHSTDTIGYDPNWNYDVVSYDYNFTSYPVVLHQVMSNNDDDWITTYVTRANDLYNAPRFGSFNLALNGAEAETMHGVETLGWVAVSSGRGVFDGIDFESHPTGDMIAGHDNGCTNVDYYNTYDTIPLVINTQQSMDDTDGSWSVKCSQTQDLVGLHSEEDQVYNWERSHSTEDHGFLAWESPYSYSSVGDGTAFENNGSLVSSAFDTGGTRAIQTVTWTEVIPVSCPLCDVTVQIRTATTQAGLSLATWSGPGGADDSFVDPDGGLVNPIHNGDRWIQYKVNLFGDGDYTPTVRDIQLNYK